MLRLWRAGFRAESNYQTETVAGRTQVVLAAHHKDGAAFDAGDVERLGQPNDTPLSKGVFSAGRIFEGYSDPFSGSPNLDFADADVFVIGKGKRCCFGCE